MHLQERVRDDVAPTVRSGDREHGRAPLHPTRHVRDGAVEELPHRLVLHLRAGGDGLDLRRQVDRRRLVEGDGRERGGARTGHRDVEVRHGVRRQTHQRTSPDGDTVIAAVFEELHVTWFVTSPVELYR